MSLKVRCERRLSLVKQVKDREGFELPQELTAIPPILSQGGALCDADSDSQASIDELAAALAKLTPEERAALLKRL